MADKKISALTSAATPLAGTEVLPIVQSGATVKVSVDNLTKGRTVNATTFDTDVAAAGVTLSGTTLSADGTDANINVNLTPKGTGFVQTTATDAIVKYRVNTENGGISVNNYSQIELADNGAIRSYWRNVRDGSGDTQFVYGTSLVFLVDPTTPVEAARFTSAGNLAFQSGKGIDFSATSSGSGTMTSELLADYEEGTWTPVLEFGGASTGITYISGYQNGLYTKVGNLVTLTAAIYTSSKGSSTGNATITGLPFNSANTNGAQSAAALSSFDISFADVMKLQIDKSASNLAFSQTTNAGVQTNLTNANFADYSFIQFSLTYRAA